MRKLIGVFVAVAILAWAPGALAQGSASANISATAEVLNAVTVTNQVDLDFGNVIRLNTDHGPQGIVSLGQSHCGLARGTINPDGVDRHYAGTAGTVQHRFEVGMEPLVVQVCVRIVQMNRHIFAALAEVL